MSKIDYNSKIQIIPTRKYKDINLYLLFSIENKPLIKEKIALLCKLIGDVSNKYPTKVEMTKARDILCGMNLSVSYKVRANIISLSIHYSFVNPKFVDTSIDEYSKYINETLFNSIIDENTFLEAKKQVKAAVLRNVDRPIRKARENVVSIISKDNPCFSIYSENAETIENIDKITLNDLKKTYQSIINNAQLNIYLCGDINKTDINKLTHFSFDNRKSVTYKKLKIKCVETEKIIDKQDISQTCLSVVYSTPFNKTHPDYFSWFMANAFLGATPTSLLFSEVREKLSLCYAISSYLYKNEGIVKIDTNIDSKNVDKTIEAIKSQIKRIIDFDYDLKMFDITKTLICNSIYEIYDDLDALIDYYYESMLSNFNYSIEEYCDNLMNVSQKDISNVYKKYRHYFDYVLLGSKHE